MNRQIIENPRSLWDRLTNWSGVLAWTSVCVYLLLTISANETLVNNALAYFAVIGPATIFGILSLLAGVGLINLLTPFFSFSKLFEGDGQSKLSGAIILVGILIALAIIIHGAN